MTNLDVWTHPDEGVVGQEPEIPTCRPIVRMCSAALGPDISAARNAAWKCSIGFPRRITEEYEGCKLE